MEFEAGWLLLAFPVVFALGWLASRFDLHQLRLDNQRTPKAYFKGLNHLLNEQHDQAIDAFIEAIQLDPDTSELHFALGNLFRRRGEYERAVRVHQHLLARADLSRTERDRAQHALAQDYLKAGLLDRAESALHLLQGTAFEGTAQLALLNIFERSRDWAKAAEMAHKLSASGPASFATRQAHYLCEQALVLAAQPGNPQARSLLEQAVALSPQHARATLALSEWLDKAGQPSAALDTLVQLAQHQPTALPLLAKPLAHLAIGLNQVDTAWSVLAPAQLSAPSIDVLDALISLQKYHAKAHPEDLYLAHLEREPSLVTATQWLSHQTDLTLPAAIHKALLRAAKPLLRYRCAACGFEATQHFWHCPGCQAWDSYPARRVEEL